MTLKVTRCLAIIFTLFCHQANSQGFGTIDWSLCDTEMIFSAECEMKVAQCGLVNSIMEGSIGSLVSNVATCSKTKGLPPNPLFFAALGFAYMTRTPEAIISQITNDVPLQQSIRECVFNGTGLVGTDGLMNKTKLIERFQSQIYFDQRFASRMSDAVSLCPEPANYDLDPFIGCLRDACLNAVPGLNAVLADLKIAGPPELRLSALPTNIPSFMASAFIL